MKARITIEVDGEIWPGFDGSQEWDLASIILGVKTESGKELVTSYGDEKGCRVLARGIIKQNGGKG